MAAQKCRFSQAISIPKSSSPDRIAQNIDAVDWTLSEEQLAVLVRTMMPLYLSL
jgi:diketogulonate reductase-like aldo/keto reductase